MGVGRCVQEPVDRLRLAPAVETFALDPGKLGQRVDQLGLGAPLGVFFEVEQGRVDVAGGIPCSRSNRLSVSSVRSLGRSIPAMLRWNTEEARSPRLGWIVMSDQPRSAETRTVH